MILKLEEIALNAWPAIEEFNLDGWVIRYANGVTKRSNSVNPIYESSQNIDEKIDVCEKFYRSKTIPVCFKITEIAQPFGLDEMLDARGYAHKFDVLIQVMDISKFIGVVEDKFIGLFDIVIDPQYRNQGFGKMLVENIMKWGKA